MKTPNITRRSIRHWLASGLASIALVSGLAGCASIPRVQAEDRLFLNLSLEYLDRVDLDVREIDGVAFGGISAIASDRRDAAGRYLVLSDDRGQNAPARFYDLTIDIDRAAGKIDDVTIGAATSLRGPDGETYPDGTIDPEGIAITPDDTLMVSSEGDSELGIAPFVAEFDRDGRHIRELPLYDYFIPDTLEERDDKPAGEQTLGVQNNAGFEALTIGGRGSAGEPYRIFAVTESPLIQDLPDLDAPVEVGAEPPIAHSRLVHYSRIGRDRSQIVAEHLYPLDPPPAGAVNTGITELLALDRLGYFISLERSYSPLSGLSAKLFQVNLGGATDTATLATLAGDLGGIEPARKRLLLDFSDLNEPVDNLEGLAFGPRLPDGSQTLLVVSDDNFSDRQVTQIWLFRFIDDSP
ncbi:MAG: esterase-like activity of phytase family protein [Geitlerinemataceae cyanobacterium]